MGKEIATCVEVVGGWDGWGGRHGRLEEGAGETYCMNSFTAEYLDYEMPAGIWLLII